ncbi:MAG TPA: hypothetical protein VD905_05360 [Flavobacteriales bacterium]|nr:hypothetical protein [Flavobacteriales bacterium]
MNRSILKPIAFGVLFGAAAFFAPFFLIKLIFFFLLMGVIFRLFWWGGRGHRLHYRMAYADKIRGMSDEEYAAFKNKAGHDHCCGHYGCGADKHEKNKSKQ